MTELCDVGVGVLYLCHLTMDESAIGVCVTMDEKVLGVCVGVSTQTVYMTAGENALGVC